MTYVTTSAAGKNAEWDCAGLFVVSPLPGRLTQSSFIARGVLLVAGRAFCPGGKVTVTSTMSST